MRRFPVLLVCLLLLFAACPVRAGSPLAAALEAVTNDAVHKHAHWGVLIVDAKTGEELYAQNPDQLFIPASTTKLYSCAAALIALGPDYRFETPVFARGSIANGRLNGNLILRATGDLTFGGRTDENGRMVYRDEDHIYAGGLGGGLTATDPLAGLKDLARQIAAAGILQVHGDVLVDDRLWVKSTGSGSGPELITPIMVNDNLVDALVVPAAEAGQMAQVTMRPPTAYVQMDAQVETVAEGKPTRVDLHYAGPHAFSVRGQIARNAKPVLRIFAVDDPTAYARALFIETLRQQGVRVSASILAPAAGELPEQESYAKLKRVAAFTSPPFSEAIKVTLKVSHNLYASTLPLLLAAKHGKRTLAEGLQLQGKVLAELGVDTKSISFAGGAGGSRADAVTPRTTVQLLRAMAQRSEYPAFHAGLPILGVDGTLATSVAADSPVKGHVYAKTGTLSWRDLVNDRNLLTSKALAGMMTTASGRELVVCMFLNGLPLPKDVLPAREGKTLGRLCEIVYQNVR
jgi:D-alanyl-D-alanine carboxypeptidase/D-alanyl-D-alanine-endopeptidase (penicillin-binding protein 4)